VYGKLTDTELELLRAGAVLGMHDKQKAYVLKRYLLPMECPACHALVPVRAALGKPVAWNNTTKDEFRCPYCLRGLELCVPFVGDDYWRLLVPIDADGKPIVRAAEPGDDGA
jgi:hypothetical protein